MKPVPFSPTRRTSLPPHVTRASAPPPPPPSANAGTLPNATIQPNVTSPAEPRAPKAAPIVTRTRSKAENIGARVGILTRYEARAAKLKP